MNGSKMMNQGGIQSGIASSILGMSA
jgi:hypothetical protein